MTAAKRREQILNRLDRVANRKSLRAHYAQLCLIPFGPIPSYAMEDDKSEWWELEAAENLRQELGDLLTGNVG